MKFSFDNLDKLTANLAQPTVRAKNDVNDILSSENTNNSLIMLVSDKVSNAFYEWRIFYYNTRIYYKPRWMSVQRARRILIDHLAQAGVLLNSMAPLTFTPPCPLRPMRQNIYS